MVITVIFVELVDTGWHNLAAGGDSDQLGLQKVLFFAVEGNGGVHLGVEVSRELVERSPGGVDVLWTDDREFDPILHD